MSRARKCMRKLDRKELEYFVYGVDKIPYMMDVEYLVNDLGTKKGDFVVMDTGMLYTYKPYRFDDLFEKNWFGGEEKNIPVPDKLYLHESKLGSCMYRKYNQSKTFNYFVFNPGMSLFPKWFNREEYHDLDLDIYKFVVHGDQNKVVTLHTMESFDSTYIVTKDFYLLDSDVDESTGPEKPVENFEDIDFSESEKSFNWYNSLDSAVKLYLIEKYFTGNVSGIINIVDMYKSENNLQ